MSTGTIIVYFIWATLSSMVVAALGTSTETEMGGENMDKLKLTTNKRSAFVSVYASIQYLILSGLVLNNMFNWF